MVTAVALLFALGFYAITGWALLRTQRLAGRTPLAFLRYGSVEMKISAVAMFIFPAVLVASTLRPDVAWLRPAVKNPSFTVLAAVLFAGGLALQYTAMRTLGKAFRIGIDPEQRDALVRDGPYRLIRHPIYAAFIAYYVAAWLLQPNLLFAIVAPVAVLRIVYQASREERALLDRYGAEYAAYARTTSRFIPFVW
jgi:protein-S-isoprenylcysteine O-methyltransferase Ste14